LTIPFLAFLLGCVSSCLFLAALVPQLRQRLLDHPNHRSSHKRPTPRGGGLSFVISGVIAAAFMCHSGSCFASADWRLAVSPLLAFPLGLIGFADDCRGLPSIWRFASQILTSIVLVYFSPLLSPSLVAIPLLLVLSISVTAVINFANFMDGIDGLVAGCMALAIGAASVQLQAPWSIWSFVGALVGFLFWNWSPAKVFMGDVGSTFLGAMFAFLVLQAFSWSEAIAFLLVATPLLADAFLCVPRRLMAGQPVFQAHRLHLFQRLHQAGWSHDRVSSLYIAATAVLAIALVLGGLAWVVPLAAVELLIGVWLDQQIAVPFALASRS
jgi:Fuc2NAc and GlcNAc transferase